MPYTYILYSARLDKYCIDLEVDHPDLNRVCARGRLQWIN